MTGLERMLSFLAHLNRRKVTFTITQESDDGLLVSFALIGKRRWSSSRRMPNGACSRAVKGSTAICSRCTA